MKTTLLLTVLIFTHSVFAQIESTTDDSIVVFSSCPPEFPGGHQKLVHYIHDNFSVDCLIESQFEYGKIYIQFIVERDGSISNQDVFKYRNESILEPGALLFPNMPIWKPACDGNGLFVRERVRIPIYLDP